MRRLSLVLCAILLMTVIFPASAHEPTDVVTIPLTSAGYGVALSPDGGSLAVFELGALHDDEVLDEFLPISVYSTTTGVPLYELTDHSDYAMDMAFSPDGAWLASVHSSGAMHVWDAESGELVKSIDGEPNSARLRFIEETGELAVLVANPDGQRIVIWDLEGETITNELPAPDESDPIVTFDISPDGSGLALALGTGKVVTVDVASGEANVLRESFSAEPEQTLRRVQFDGTAARVVYLDLFEGLLTVMDASSGEIEGIVLANTEHFAVEGEQVIWVDQFDDLFTHVYVSSFSALSEPEIFEFFIPIDMKRAPADLTRILAFESGKLVMGGSLNPDNFQNLVLVITP